MDGIGLGLDGIRVLIISPRPYCGVVVGGDYDDDHHDIPRVSPGTE